MSQILASPSDQEQPSVYARHAEDPIALFQTWFREAIDSGIDEPSAMTVATIDPKGYPDARMLLL